MIAGGPIVAGKMPTENVYLYDEAVDVRAIGGQPSTHIEVWTAKGDETWWLAEWRSGVVSPAYGGRPGAYDVWLSRREIPIRVDRELWAALAFDLEAIRTDELDAMRCRITQTLDEAFGFAIVESDPEIEASIQRYRAGLATS